MNVTQETFHSRTASGEQEPLFGNYFVSTYPPFYCWTTNAPGLVDPLQETADRSAGDVPLGLYVHIPFCAKRCEYCYYLTRTDPSRQAMDRYLDAILKEASMYAAAPALAGRTISFAYIGGGTPSLLSVQNITRLLHGLKEAFHWRDVREITFECAPQTVTEPKLRVLREAGVTRVSLGVQQLNDTVLNSNGRIHRVRDVARAYAAIRNVGFPIVNLDLIVGMVGETDETFRESLERVIVMAPESVTIYQLEIPRNTSLYRVLQQGQSNPLPASWSVKQARLAWAFARLEEAGYTIRSGYAAVRDPKRHAFVYQDAQYRGADLVGLGVSSFSCVAEMQFQNTTSLDAYRARLDEGRLPVARGYRLSEEEQLIREFVLQLKLGSADADYFADKFGVEIGKRFAEPLTRLAGEELLNVNSDGVRLTRGGLLCVDRILRNFYLPEHRDAPYW